MSRVTLYYVLAGVFAFSALVSQVNGVIPGAFA